MGNMARGMRFLLAAACLVVIIAGLRTAAPLLIPLLLSLFLAILSLPLIVWLEGKRVPIGLAIGFTVLTVIAVLAGIVLIVGGSVQSFTREAPKYADRLQEMATTLVAWLQARGIQASPAMVREVINPGAVMGLVGEVVNGVAAVLSNIVLVLLTMILVLFEITRVPKKLALAIGHRERDVEHFTKIIREVQRYLGMKTLISLVTGLLIGVWVAILGVDYPVLWGLIAFLFNYIPNLGSILAAVPTALLALVQYGLGRAALVGLGYFVVNMVLGNFVEPYIMGRRLGLSTLVIFVSLVFWGWLWGPMGMLLSVPLTMVVKILLENTEEFRWVALLLAPSPEREA